MGAAYRQIDDKERQKILELRAQGLACQRIAERVGRSNGTIQSVLKKAGVYKPLPRGRSGSKVHPRKVRARSDFAVILTCRICNKQFKYASFASDRLETNMDLEFARTYCECKGCNQSFHIGDLITFEDFRFQHARWKGTLSMPGNVVKISE